MKVYDTSNIRNIALLGHGGTGKTTLSESVLMTAGVINRMGTIESGNTKSDYLEDETKRQISISTSILQMEWSGRKVNLIDTPGYADFVGEVICGMRAADSAFIVISALKGLEVGTESAWDICEKQNKPRGIIINQVGRENVKIDEILSAVQDRFGIRALPLQIPVNPGVGFNKIVDILTMKEYTYGDTGKGKAADISGDYQSQAEEYHEKLIEAAAESDDSLMEKFFDSGLTPEEVSAGVKKAILECTLIPIIFVDALTSAGTDLFLNLITENMPSPADLPNVTAKKNDGEDIELKPSADAPIAMQVFKTVIEPHVGELSMFRMLSGSYKAGDELYNVDKSTSEKPTQMFTLVGQDRTEVATINAGDIGTFVKMKSTRTGDSLTSKQLQVKLPDLEFPEPVMDVAVYPKTKGDEDKIAQGLAKLFEEDPSFTVTNNPELKQIILDGQGGMHIDVIIDRLKRKNNIEVELKAPKIPYRETITGNADEKYRYKKQTGGRGQYGEVYFRMEPTPRGEGFLFSDEIKGGVIPARFIPAVEKGVVEAMHEGPLSKSKVVDIKVTLYYGSYHTVDSSEMAFKMAASMCFKDCFLKSRPILLEPIYNVQIKVPDAYTGDVMGDLSSRRGKIMGMEPQGIFQLINAQIPLAELYMYSTNLRSLTQGSGAYTRTFSHYELVPPDIAQKVIEQTKQEEEE